MRTLSRVLFTCSALLLMTIPARSGTTAPDKLEHPGQVALVETTAGWGYQHFPSNVRLYVYDADSPGKSNCNLGCAGAWQPLIAPDGEKPVGDWTKITREDGRQQWAYKDRPVYLRYHGAMSGSSSDDATAATWHVLEP